jgi:hypothetical protein
MSAQVEVFDDLHAAARDAGAALTRDARPWMFDRIDWFKLVHDFTPPPGKPLAIRAQNGRASAWLFVAVEGGSAVALSNWYCLRYGTIVVGDDGTAAVDALVGGLRKAGVSRVSLAPIGGDDPLPAALKRHGWVTARSQSTVNWRIRTSGMTFEDYWATRPSRLRNTVKRRSKASQLDLVVHHEFDARAWEDYESVYNASWKPAEGSPPLMRKLAEAEGAAGTLRLGLAYHDKRAVAAQLWIVEHGLATIHKLSYREDAKHLSAGTILSVEMFRRAIDDDKVDMIDFGIGDDGYKKDWMAECVPLYALEAYDGRSLKGIAALGRSVGSKLVGRLRSLYAARRQGLREG